MTWTVVWKPSAEQHLANMWIGAADRQAITDAANQRELFLKYLPDQIGESRDGDRRILIVPPLAVVYKVDDMDRKVTVLAVWHIGNHD